MSTVKQYTTSVVDAIQAVIPSGQTKSGIVDTWGATIVMLELPAAFDGTEISFETSSDNITFQQYRNIDDIPVTITCTQGNNYGLAAQDFFPARYVKLVSNVTETAQRTIRLVPKPV